MHEEIAVSRGILTQLDSKTKAKEYYVRLADYLHINSSWDGGGSKCNYYAFDAQGNPCTLPAHSGALQFGGSEADVQLDGVQIMCIVKESIFRGKHMKPAIYLPTLLFKAAKKQVEHAQGTGNLTDMQLYALAVTAQLKSSGRRDEFAQAFPVSEWDATRAQLVELKLLRKNNAITPAGRNAAADVQIGWARRARN